MSTRTSSRGTLLAVLALAMTANADLHFTSTMMPSPSDPNFETWTFTLNTDDSDSIVGWHGQFTSNLGINQQYPFGMPTVYMDNNNLFAEDPAAFQDLDSQYLFETQVVDSVNGALPYDPFEDGNELTGGFCMIGGRNNPHAGATVDIAQVCVPAGAEITILGGALMRDAEDNLYLEPYSPPGAIYADAGGPYQINIGETLTLDASGTLAPGCWDVKYRWDLDYQGYYETKAGRQAIFDVPYADLLALGLSPNPGNPVPIRLRAYADTSDGGGMVSDYVTTYVTTTLEIIPEPASLGLLALGGLAVLRRRRRAR